MNKELNNLLAGLGEDVLAEAERLRSLPREEFKREIHKIKDNKRLADLRYPLGYDPHPLKSSVWAIDINRLITERNTRRSALPQWVGIIISGLIGLAALIVAILKNGG